VSALRQRAHVFLRLLAGPGLALLVSACASAPLPQLAPPPPTLSDAEVQRRYDFIKQRLDASKLHAQIWYGSWLAISGGSAAYGVVEAAMSDNDGDRADGVAGAILGTIGVGYVVLVPLQARYGADNLRGLPDATPEERRMRLQRAQEILREDAERAQIASSSWTAHLMGASVGLVAGAAVWAVSRNPTPAIITGATGVVGSEVQFWAEPLQPQQDLMDYVQEFGLGPPPTTYRWHLEPVTGGLAIRFDF
jgi:hypothetical protein